jgi:hypothetical protein
VTETAPALREKELSQWRLIARFRERLAGLEPTAARAAASWEDPRRKLQQADYLSLFLFALVNPAVRALCEASHWARVRREVCGEPVSLGSFSEAQALVDPGFLERVFAELAGERPGPPPKDPRAAWQSWWAQDRGGGGE